MTDPRRHGFPMPNGITSRGRHAILKATYHISFYAHLIPLIVIFFYDIKMSPVQIYSGFKTIQTVFISTAAIWNNMTWFFRWTFRNCSYVCTVRSNNQCVWMEGCILRYKWAHTGVLRIMGSPYIRYTWRPPRYYGNWKILHQRTDRHNCL